MKNIWVQQLTEEERAKWHKLLKGKDKQMEDTTEEDQSVLEKGANIEKAPA